MVIIIRNYLKPDLLFGVYIQASRFDLKALALISKQVAFGSKQVF